MSNQNNNDHSGVAMVIAFIGATMMVLVAFFAALAAFAALVFTIIALCAWNHPIRVLGDTLYPAEARAFVKRGLLGAVLLPCFVIFCAILFDFRIEQNAWAFLMLGGYTLGSLGIEIMMADARQETAANTTYFPPQPAAPQPPPHVPPRWSGQPHEHFTFADWNDEEGPR